MKHEIMEALPLKWLSLGHSWTFSLLFLHHVLLHIRSHLELWNWGVINSIRPVALLCMHDCFTVAAAPWSVLACQVNIWEEKNQQWPISFLGLSVWMLTIIFWLAVWFELTQWKVIILSWENNITLQRFATGLILLELAKTSWLTLNVSLNRICDWNYTHNLKGRLTLCVSLS